MMSKAASRANSINIFCFIIQGGASILKAFNSRTSFDLSNIVFFHLKPPNDLAEPPCCDYGQLGNFWSDSSAVL